MQKITLILLGLLFSLTSFADTRLVDEASSKINAPQICREIAFQKLVHYAQDGSCVPTTTSFRLVATNDEGATKLAWYEMEIESCENATGLAGRTMMTSVQKREDGCL